MIRVILRIETQPRVVPDIVQKSDELLESLRKDSAAFGSLSACSFSERHYSLLWSHYVRLLAMRSACARRCLE
jgi:hypothetical protein